MSRKKVRKNSRKKTPAGTRSSGHFKIVSEPSSLTSIGAFVQKAEALYHQNKNKEVISTLESVGEKPVFDNKNQELHYFRLLMFSLINENKLVQAEKMIDRALELDNTDRDIYFAEAFVKTSFKEYDAALRACREFIKLAKKQGKSDKKFLSDRHQHLIHNYMGLAFKEKNDLIKAESAFLSAIEANKADSHPYLNLANLYRRQKKYDKAKEIVEKGMKNCSQVQELRMCLKSLDNRQTISACMMVKNEEELLSNCLKSIRDWVDEIVVIDTGSTDKTVDIARSYGAKVYFQEWSKDFSKHRNYSISKATCDWIFIIDADEEFTGGLEEVRQAMNLEQYRIISINVFNMNRETGEHSSFLPSNRFFLRDAGFQYEGIVHNQLKFPEDETIPRTNARINHYGYNLDPEAMEKKHMRSRELLEYQLKENPDNIFAHFNYAQLMRGISSDEAHNMTLKHACRVVELSSMDDNAALHLQAHHQQITALFNLKRYQDAVDLCHKVLKLHPDYLDPILSLGHLYASLERFDDAEKYFNKYLELQKNYDPSKETLNLILLYVSSRHVAYYGIGLIKQFQKKYGEAEKCYLKTMEHQNPYLDTYIRLANVYLDAGKFEETLPYLEKELELKPESAIANVTLARYHGMINDEKNAEKYLEQALKLAENEPEVFERSAVYWANKGNFNKAIPLMEKLVEIKPKYGHGLNILAKALYETGDFNKSLEIYTRYLEIIKDDSQALNNLANCYFKTGDFEQAEIAYSKALEVDENLAVSYRNLGLTKMNLRKFKEAIPLLENYVDSSPDDIQIEFVLATIYCELEQYSEAIPHFEKFLANNPENIYGLFGISECYYKLGYIQSALIGYSQVLKLKPDFQPVIDRLNEVETSVSTT